MNTQRGAFAPNQIKQLLEPIKNTRVLAVQGHSHVSQQDITAHLIRMFGFGNFDIEVLDASLVFEDARMKDDKPSGRYDVCYRAMVRLTIRNEAGETVAVYENGSTATGQNQSRGDGHDLAYKSAISLSIKRAAIALGDQFGLSLYNKGQLAPLVIGTLVGAPEPVGDPQEAIPQQVSLGNDETDKTEPAEVVEQIPEEVTADWISAFDECTDLAGLQKIWEEAGRAGVTRDPDIIAAKDRKKASL